MGALSHCCCLGLVSVGLNYVINNKLVVKLIIEYNQQVGSLDLSRVAPLVLITYIGTSKLVVY